MRIAHHMWPLAATIVTAACSSGSGARHSSGDSTPQNSGTSTAQVQMEPVSQVGGDANVTASGVTDSAAPQTGTSGATASLTTDMGLAIAPGGGTMSDAQKAQTQLVQSCLVGWPNNPFGPTKVTPDQALTANVTILNLNAAIDDTNVTATPSLILISSGVTLLGDSTYKLLNPNGWYCMPTANSILGGSIVQIKATAHLSQGGTNVDLSQAASAAVPFIPIGLGGGSHVEIVE